MVVQLEVSKEEFHDLVKLLTTTPTSLDATSALTSDVVRTAVIGDFTAASDVIEEDVATASASDAIEDLATASDAVEDVATASDVFDRNKLRVSNVTLDFNAFQFKQNGEPRRSPNAAYVAKSTACSAIVSAIKAARNKEQHALTLHSALENEELQDISVAVGIRSKDMEAKLFIFQQIKEMLQLVMKRNSQKGPTDCAKASLVNNVLIASAPNLIEGPEQILIPDPKAPSFRMIANALGFKKSTGCRLLNRVKEKRHALCSTVNARRWIQTL
jgi:hypothetical protein